MRTHLPEGAIDLGANHWYTTFIYDAENHPGAPDPAGIIEWHLTPDGDPCGGAVNFWRPATELAKLGHHPVWTVESLDPLTISPSVLCDPSRGGCGSHGFIRSGQWVGA